MACNPPSELPLSWSSFVGSEIFTWADKWLGPLPRCIVRDNRPIAATSNRGGLHFRGFVFLKNRRPGMGLLCFFPQLPSIVVALLSWLHQCGCVPSFKMVTGWGASNNYSPFFVVQDHNHQRWCLYARLHSLQEGSRPRRCIKLTSLHDDTRRWWFSLAAR